MVANKQSGCSPAVVCFRFSMQAPPHKLASSEGILYVNTSSRLCAEMAEVGYDLKVHYKQLGFAHGWWACNLDHARCPLDSFRLCNASSERVRVRDKHLFLECR